MIDTTNNPTRIATFNGGLNTKISELNGMKPNETPDCMNVYSDTDGSLQKRNGRTKLNSSAAGAGSKDSNMMFDSGGTLMSLFGTTLYKMDELDGTYDELKTGLNDCKWFGARYDTNFVMGSYDYNTPYYWDGVTATATELSDAPKARYPMEWQGYLWWWNVLGNNSRLQRSDYAEYTSYTATSYNDVPTNDGDFGTGFALLKGVMYLFKRWSIHRVSYLGGSPLIDIRQMTDGVGTISHETIRNITIPGKGEVLIFLAPDKRLYIFDGYNATAVSEKFEESNGICPIALDTLNRGGMKFSHATVDAVKKWYILFVPNGGVSTITHSLVYNYATGACFPNSNQTLGSSTVMSDSNDRLWVIAGDYDGYAYRMEYGNSDNGTAITEYYTTPRIFIKDPAVLTKSRTARIDFSAQANDTVNFYHREDYSNSWSDAQTIPLYNSCTEYYLGENFALGTATLGPLRPVVQTLIDLPYLNNFIQFKLGDSLTIGPWRCYCVDFMGKSIGYGEQGDTL